MSGIQLTLAQTDRCVTLYNKHLRGSQLNAVIDAMSEGIAIGQSLCPCCLAQVHGGAQEPDDTDSRR